MTLLDFVRLTRANWRLIFVVASLALVAAFLWTLTRPVMYASTASAQVYVGSSNDIGQLSASLGLSQKKADIYAAYVGLGRRPSTWWPRISRSRLGQVSLSGAADPITSSVIVTGYAGTPEAAQALAQAGVEATADVAKEAEDKSLPQGASVDSLVRLEPVDNASLPAAPLHAELRAQPLLRWARRHPARLPRGVHPHEPRPQAALGRRGRGADRYPGAGHRARRQGPRPPSDREHRRLQPRPRGRGLPPAAHQLPVRRRRQPGPQRGDHQRQRG